MGTIEHQANSYVRTGTVKSKRSVVEQGVFKELKTSNMLIGVGREIYSRYSVEIAWSITVVTWMLIIFSKAGVL